MGKGRLVFHLVNLTTELDYLLTSITALFKPQHLFIFLLLSSNLCYSL